MPNPSGSSAVYRVDLRNTVAEEWDTTGEMDGFVADQALPPADVPTAAGTVHRISREQMTKDPQLDRAADGRYNRSGLSDETFTYITHEKGHEVPIDDKMQAMAADYYDAERAAALMCMSKIMRGKEIRTAAALFNPTTFAAYTGPVGTEWSTVASATPITDVKDAIETVRRQCGLRPNTLLLSSQSWNKLTECTQVLNRINGGSDSSNPARASLSAVAELMNIREIIVGGGVKDSANEGQDFSGADIWDDEYALLYFKRPSPSLQSMQLGACWHWGGDGSQKNVRLETYRSEEARCDVVRGRHQVHEKVQYPECGYLFSNINA